MKKLGKYSLLCIVLAVITLAVLLTYGCKCQFVTEFKCDSTGKCSVTQKLVCTADNVPPAGTLDPMIQLDMLKDLMVVNETVIMDFVVMTDRGIKVRESIPFKQYGKPLASRVIKNALSYKLVPVNNIEVQQFYTQVMKNTNKSFSATMTTTAAYRSVIKTAPLTRLSSQNIRLAARWTPTERLASLPITFK